MGWSGSRAPRLVGHRSKLLAGSRAAPLASSVALGTEVRLASGRHSSRSPEAGQRDLGWTSLSRLLSCVPSLPLAGLLALLSALSSSSSRCPCLLLFISMTQKAFLWSPLAPQFSDPLVSLDLRLPVSSFPASPSYPCPMTQNHLCPGADMPLVHRLLTPSSPGLSSPLHVKAPS